MKVLFKSFAAAVLMSTFATIGSAQNTGVPREAGASMPGAVRAPRYASAASGRRETAPDNRGTSAPADQGVTRGGPENPSGLKKPD